MSRSEPNEPDTTSYPIIRIDQIHLFDTHALRKCNEEAAKLLADILEEHQLTDDSAISNKDQSIPRDDESSKTKVRPKLADYIEKQIQRINKELIERSATQRIDDILDNICKDKSLRSSSSFKEATIDPSNSSSHNRTTSVTSSSAAFNRAMDDCSTFKPLLLPSEIMASPRQSEAASSINLVAKSFPTAMSSSDIRKGTRRRSEHEETANSNTLPTPPTHRPSQHVVKANEEVFKNFGNIFMVAATDKKVRFYPKKAPAESVAEVKERERLERRKIAMSRLMQRREERQVQLQKRRELKRDLRIARKKGDVGNLSDAAITTNRPLSSTPASADSAQSLSSDSESVSGGDDDIEIDIDEKVVNNFGRELNSFYEDTPGNHSDGLDIAIDGSSDGKTSTPTPRIADRATFPNHVSDEEASKTADLILIQNNSVEFKAKDESPKQDITTNQLESFAVSTESEEYYDNPKADRVDAEHYYKPHSGDYPLLSTSNISRSGIRKENNEQTEDDRPAPPSRCGDEDHSDDHLIDPPVETNISVKLIPTLDMTFTPSDSQTTLNTELSACFNPIPPSSSSNEFGYFSSYDYEMTTKETNIDTTDQTSDNIGNQGQIAFEDTSDKITAPSSIKAAAPSVEQRKSNGRIRNGGIIKNKSAPSSITIKLEKKSSDHGNAKGILSEIYPHIGMIFPVSIGLYGSSIRQADSFAARTLLEGMHLQVKLYDEWIDVMGDYATVFSEDRGFAMVSNTSNNDSSKVYSGNTKALHYRVKSSRPEVGNIITDVLNAMDFHDEISINTDIESDAESLSSRSRRVSSPMITSPISRDSGDVDHNMPLRKDRSLKQSQSQSGSSKIWQELPQGLGLGVSWNLLWTWSKPHVNTAHLLVWQKINHFESNQHLTRKDLLRKSLQRFTDFGSKISESFEIMPQTFVLPHEYTQFVTAFTSYESCKRETSISNSTRGQQDHIEDSQSKNYWIMKPVGLSRGRGISLVQDINAVTYSQASVIQRYVDKPLLLKGYKFDLRLYVLVTSFQPLEAFIYRDGFARLSTQAYSTSADDLDNKFIHLTNSSIQKYNTDALSSDNPLQAPSSDVGGSKIRLEGPGGLWKRLDTCLKGISCEELWQRICLVVLKSLVVVDEKIHHQPCSFEVFGYDIIFDESCKPWLLEVNASPSLARENSIDHKVKNAMIRDTIRLIDPAPYDREAVARILKRRLNDIAKNKVISSHRSDPMLESDLKEILGDYIPRKYGEMPKVMGNYERLCPSTKTYDSVLKLKNKLIKPLV